MGYKLITTRLNYFQNMNYFQNNYLLVPSVKVVTLIHSNAKLLPLFFKHESKWQKEQLLKDNITNQDCYVLYARDSKES